MDFSEFPNIDRMLKHPVSFFLPGGRKLYRMFHPVSFAATGRHWVSKLPRGLYDFHPFSLSPFSLNQKVLHHSLLTLTTSLEKPSNHFSAISNFRMILCEWQTNEL